jgi:biotin-(acetyl-CoA carboxylase) ligase
MDDYRSLSILIGQNVRFEKDGKVLCAKALRIEDNGSLTVSLNGEELSLSSGEVHLIM